MNAATQEFRRIGRRMAGNPAAVFVAVLTAGMAVGSFFEHPCVALAGPNTSTPVSERTAPATPACSRTTAAAGANRTSPARPSQQPVNAVAATATRTSSVTAAGGGPADRHESGKPAPGTAGRGFSSDLPDFSAPELSRFTSPL
jgi:hypothetical protein